MLPRVTMPRITLGKEREDRDKQHESLRCSCRTKHPLSASLQESVQLLHGNNAALDGTLGFCVSAGHRVQFPEVLQTHTQGSRCCGAF